MSATNPYRGLAGFFGIYSNELYTERFYGDRKIDTSELYKYNNYCNVTVHRNHKKYMNKLCKRILKYLDKSRVWNENENVYDDCILFNYWVYGELAKHFSDDPSYINTAFSGLQLIWTPLTKDSRYSSFYKKCKPMYEKILYHKDWEQRKVLYDYYVDYDTLFGTAQGYPEKCEEYYGKIQKIIPVYRYFEGHCSSDLYDCPDFFYKCKEKNPESALQKLPCHDTIKGRTVSTSDGGSSHQQPDSAEGAKNPEDGPALEAVTELGSEDSGIGTKVTNSVLGAAPVLLTATALYRYTPLGPWIRRLGGGRTNNMNDMDTFSSYTPETGDMFSDESANYISYHPM
ncbi:Plasmodium vivax Vir protein, putative [Plasmodium vivax]|nr:Plasmodium vivax Vir protein, putative [Plasmodium vivax]